MKAARWRWRPRRRPRRLNFRGVPARREANLLRRNRLQNHALPSRNTQGARLHSQRAGIEPRPGCRAQRAPRPTASQPVRRNVSRVWSLRACGAAVRPPTQLHRSRKLAFLAYSPSVFPELVCFSLILAYFDKGTVLKLSINPITRGQAKACPASVYLG